MRHAFPTPLIIDADLGIVTFLSLHDVPVALVIIKGRIHTLVEDANGHDWLGDDHDAPREIVAEAPGAS